MGNSFVHRIKVRFPILRNLKELSYICMGMGLFFAYVIWKKGDLYRAAGEFYKTIQMDGQNWRKSIAVKFCNNPLGRMFREYWFLQANKDKDRLSTGVIEEYSDESLLGYGDINYDKGGKTLAEQQRGLMIPLLEKSLNENRSRLKRVVEIGCGNGDILAHLAAKYGDYEFIGVDFFVKNATTKHASLKNLSFLKGYAMDLMEKGVLKGDIVYANSTFCVFTPKELEKYIESCKRAGFKEIILEDPSWHEYVQKNNDEIVSKHIERSVWFHNYAGYLRRAGYRPSDFEFFPYKSPKSVRPDLKIVLVRAVS